MGLIRYTIRRSLEIVPVILVILSINFFIIRMAPCDPVDLMVGRTFNPTFTEEMISAIKAEVRRTYGLDKPLHIQLAIYLLRILRGDLGYSYYKNAPVATIIWKSVRNSLLLILPSMATAVIVGTLIGAEAARRQNSKVDDAITIISTCMYATPVFWIGMILIVLFSHQLRLFPVVGMESLIPKEGIIARTFDILWHLFLPALSIFISTLPAYVRLARASVIEVMREDFIITFRAAGLGERAIFFRHALRNALLPTVTNAGLMFGLAFSFTILVETVFAWPGIGFAIHSAIGTRDYPVLLGIFLFISLCVVVACYITDIICALLDPRIVFK